MKIYVAAKFEEALRARALMDRLEDLGHTITEDWTRHPASTPREQWRGIAIADVGGAAEADVFVLLWHPHLQGGLVELGVAIASSASCIVVGAPKDSLNIFFELAEHVDDDDHAIKLISQVTPRSSA